MKKYIWATFYIITILGVFVYTCFFNKSEETKNIALSTEKTNEIKDVQINEKQKFIEKILAKNGTSIKLDNSQSLFETLNSNKNITEENYVVQRGDTLISVLNHFGIEKEEVKNLYNLIKSYYNPKNLSAGQIIYATRQKNSENSMSLISLIIQEDSTARVIIEKNEKGSYFVRKDIEELIDELGSAIGKVDGALSVSMRNTGISGNVIANFSNILSPFINFRKDVNHGDTFRVIYEQQVNSKGDVLRFGNILYAGMELNSQSIGLYRYKDNKGNVGYYNANGKSMSINNKKKVYYSLNGQDLLTFKNQVSHLQKTFKHIFEKDGKIIDDTNFGRNTEILENLQQKLSRNMMKAIESIELDYRKKERQEEYIATVYLKHGYENLYKTIPYRIVQEILNILIEEGHQPFNEKTWVSAISSQKVKGVTGQNLVSPFGTAMYNYTNDSIDWKPWSNNIFDF